MISLHEFILGHLDLLLYRDHLIDLFTDTEKLPIIKSADGSLHPGYESELYIGKLCVFDNKLHFIAPNDGSGELDKTKTLILVEINHPVIPQLCKFNEEITVHSGQIANYNDGKGPMKTRVGLLVVNYVFLAEPFGDKLPYINETITKIDQIEGPMLPLVLDGVISVHQYNDYRANAFFLGQFSELCVPVFSKKALMTSPEVKKRKKELLEENKEALANGDAVVMNKIENELITLDKEWMKDDPAMGFLANDPGKSFNVHRKKMFIAGGMVEQFGHKNQFSFVENSLAEGWSQKDLPSRCNEIRSNSYSRAMETAKGGEETKFIIRVFQNTKILEENCNTDHYLRVDLTRTNHKEFYFRYILQGGEEIELTDDNITGFIGKSVQMRSPMHCHTKGGYCYTCAGGLFKRLGQESLTFVAVALSSSFTTAALKKQHGGSIKTIDLDGVNKFLIGKQRISR